MLYEQKATPRRRILIVIVISILVVFLHGLIYYVMLQCPVQAVNLNTANQIEATEGTNQPLEFEVVNIPVPEPVLPKSTPEPTTIATKVNDPELSDIKQQPPTTKKITKPTPKAKPIVKTKKTSSKRIDIHNTKKSTALRPTNQALGNKGRGSQAFTSASQIGGYLNNPKPPYPDFSLRRGEEGTVYLRVYVTETGNPKNVQIYQSSGYRRLDNSALETVRKYYKFTPATRGGKPVSSSYIFGITFSISNR